MRAIDPNEVETIRKIVQEQIRRRAQPKADELTQQYSKMLQGQADKGFVNKNIPPVRPVEQ